MKTKSQDGRTPRQARSLKRWCVSQCLLLATAWPAPSFSQGTPEQRLACTPDVFRLCSAFIPNADDITICLRERNSELSDACRQVIQVEITQMPGTRDSNSTRKRTIR